LREAEIREAEVWHAKLDSLEPETFRSLEVKAHLLHKKDEVLNKNGEAVEAEKAVPFLRKLVVGNEKLARPVAILLEKIGQAAAAEEMFERYVAQSKEPERVLVLAAFLGRQNRPDEALALCESAWKTCAPEAVSGVSVAILYEAKSGKTHAVRVAERLESEIAKHSDKPAIMGHLAAVRRLQGRDQDAIVLFRKVAERDKSDALTMNNLAWVLALGGKADEALADESLEIVNKAIDLRGELPTLLDTRAVAYLAKKQYALAVLDLKNVVDEAPTGHRYFHLAQAQLGAGDGSAAADALQRAKSLGLKDESSVDVLERAAYQQLLADLVRP
jgi:tetratricopeptide (TPR) repeat protein